MIDTDIWEEILKEIREEEERGYQCECGAVTVWGPDTRIHSDWCPRYEASAEE